MWTADLRVELCPVYYLSVRIRTSYENVPKTLGWYWQCYVYPSQSYPFGVKVAVE